LPSPKLRTGLHVFDEIGGLSAAVEQLGVGLRLALGLRVAQALVVVLGIELAESLR